MKSWTYNGVEINDISQFPEGAVGFVYKITNVHTGKFYIGKKILRFKRTKALTKKELTLITDKRSSKKKTVITESDWKTYYGSEEKLKNDIKLYGTDYLSRVIICICNSTKQMTYQEVKQQILHGCLESDNCYNSQILGKFWKKDAI